jgi:hypothetical protein
MVTEQAPTRTSSVGGTTESSKGLENRDRGASCASLCQKCATHFSPTFERFRATSGPAAAGTAIAIGSGMTNSRDGKMGLSGRMRSNILGRAPDAPHARASKGKGNNMSKLSALALMMILGAASAAACGGSSEKDSDGDDGTAPSGRERQWVRWEVERQHRRHCRRNRNRRRFAAENPAGRRPRTPRHWGLRRHLPRRVY